MQLFPANPSGGVLIWRNSAYTLTQVEFEILTLIVNNAPISANDIGARVFPKSPPEMWQRMVSNYVTKLRRKIELGVIDASKNGYRFKEEMELPQSRMRGELWVRQRALP